MNYTQDQTAYMVEEYQNKPTRITVDRLAKELGKSSKSIIGKLSREGVYQRNVYKTKAGEMPVTKTLPQPKNITLTTRSILDSITSVSIG